MKVEIFRVYGNETDIAEFARKSRNGGVASVERNANLCKSLLVAEHGTPFEIASIIWDITAPRDVADQLLRYRQTTPNVMSLRVCAPPPVDECESGEQTWYKMCLDEYERRIAVGYSREEARKCLPLSTPTRFYWSTNIRELEHIFEQRITLAAQTDTRRVVEQMHREATKLFPNCFHSVVYHYESLNGESSTNNVSRD